MREKQKELCDLLAKERHHSSPPTTPLPSPQHIITARTQDLPSWNEATPTIEPGPHLFPYNRHLNQVVSLHRESITSLACDALVMPLSSCFRPESGAKNGTFFLMMLQNLVRDVLTISSHSLFQCCFNFFAMEGTSCWMSSR